MPGIVVFGRRWSVGSDDMVVPALLLVVLHVIWLVALMTIFMKVEFDVSRKCSNELKEVVLGYIVILLACLIVESVIMLISIRGGILDIESRASMQYLLYIRIVVFLAELAWLVVGIKWLVLHYMNCDPRQAMKAVLGISVFNSCMVLILFICLWCTFDSAGRKWVKFKRYQESMKERTTRSRRSGGSRRNWRQRKAMRAYEESWDRRLGLLCCCVERKGRNKNSMSEIAELFTDFFRDLDIVPSDVIAGLVLLRRFQKLRMKDTIQQDVNDVYSYLSGVAVTPHTQFLQLGQSEVLQHYKLVIHYMRFAMAAYGWPIFMMLNTGTGLCRLLPYLRCCCCQTCTKGANSDYVLNDNCCQCNVVALKKLCDLPDADLVYVTYHVDIGETPFFIALDNKYKKIVICVRGTLSLQDILTDLKADAETLPLDPVQEDWVGHKGMVQAAKYIRQKLDDDMILTKAFEKCKERTSEKYGLVLVGHSLGAGTAAILAIMLHQEYEDIKCYAYSPPGGLLSRECMEATKSYITSVVIGKDVVPRIGLHQMELLRTDLINIIKKSRNPKWKIIMKALCCGTESTSQMTYEEIKADVERDVTTHPFDEQIGLTAHKPMYPPGRIILIVRNHHGGTKTCCGTSEPVYQAIWADNSDFQEVLVSPTMVNDHMPDNVMEALEKVLVNVAPPKPTRLLTETERNAVLNHDNSPGTTNSPIHQQYETTIHAMDFTSSSNNANILLESMSKTVVNPSNMINANKNIWDLATEELLLSLDRHHLFPALNKFPPLDLDLSSEWTHAPLASPEALSASSSSSALSRAEYILKGEYKSESSPSKLETIKQSPEMKERTESMIFSAQNECTIITDIDAPNNSSNVVKDLDGGICYAKSASDIFQRSVLLKPMSNVCIADAIKGSLNNLIPSSYCINEICSDTAELVDISHVVSSSSLSASEHLMEENNTEESAHADETLLAPTFSETFIEGDNSGSSHLNKHLEEEYNRHSPIENTQYGYGNINEIYSPASVGYHPEHSIGYSKPIVMVPLDSNFSASSKRDKCLHYSQSESQLKGLSNEYTMKRSTEEGDIAHLGDTNQVFVGDSKNKKVLRPKESEPILRIGGETPHDNEKLSVLHENNCLNFDQMNVSNNKDDNLNVDTIRDCEILKKHDLDTQNNCLDNVLDIQPKDQHDCVDDRLQGNTSHDNTCFISACCKNENENHRTSLNLDPICNVDSPDDGNSRIVNTNSCRSNRVNSTCEESDKQLSVVLGNSEIIHLIETDV